MRIAGWVVIAATTAGASSAQGAPLAEHLELYDATQVSEIVWGQESDAGEVGIMDPPYFTAKRDRVEVLVFARYTDKTWQRAQPFTAAWRQSLPAGVVVRRLPMGVGSNRNHGYRADWKVHQRVYFAGELGGIEDEVHEAMVARISQAGSALGSQSQVARLARTVGTDPAVFTQWIEAPIVEARVRQASAASWERSLADSAQGADPQRRSLYPAMIINGRYTVSASALGDPGEAYRIANRIIRQELDAGRTHDGPTNDAEFAEWMAPREGEVFGRQRFGRTLKFRGVYSHARRELWELDDAGAVTRAYRLTGEGERAYFAAGDGK